MSGQTIKIICDARREGKSDPADLHDQAGHHRYYGRSVEKGGEPVDIDRLLAGQSEGARQTAGAYEKKWR